MVGMRATQTRFNPYRRAARLEKLRDLRTAINSTLETIGTPGAAPGDVADAFSRFSLSDWRRFALAYGVNPPSQETVNELLDSLRATVVVEVAGGVG